MGLGAVLVATALITAACSGKADNQVGATTTAPASPTSTTGHQSASTTPTTVKPRAWSAPTNVGHGVALGALSCPATTSCIALGDQGQAYHYAAGAWSGPVATGAASGATGSPSLSCSGTSFCMAVWRGGADAVVWNGRSWSTPMTISGSQAIQAVGCASSTFCVVIDGVGDAFYYNGSGWSSTPNDWGSVQSISCPIASFCVSVAGGVSIWNGSSWTEPQVYGTTSVLTGVSCPIPSFCMAVDSTGESLRWDGRTWSGPLPVETSSSTFGGPAMAGVSCPSASFCIAVDSAGMAFRWNGRRWSAPESVDPGQALTAVSCTNPAFCVSTDKQGFVLVRR